MHLPRHFEQVARPSGSGARAGPGYGESPSVATACRSGAGLSPKSLERAFDCLGGCRSSGKYW